MNRAMKVVSFCVIWPSPRWAPGGLADGRSLAAPGDARKGRERAPARSSAGAAETEFRHRLPGTGFRPAGQEHRPIHARPDRQVRADRALGGRQLGGAAEAELADREV